MLSTWGHIQVGGLTEIELFDITGTKIRLVPADIIIKNAGKILTDTGKLINGSYLTNDEKEMWVCSLPDYKKCLEIYIYSPKSSEIGAIRLWNYNKSTLESVKGIKEIEMLINGENVWNGLVQRGEGNDNVDYSTVIQIDKWTKVPPVILKNKYIDPPERQEFITEVDETLEEEKTKAPPPKADKRFLSRLEHAREEAESLKDVKPDADNSSSSVPIWFKGKSSKDSSTDVSNKNDVSSGSILPDLGSKATGGLSRRQAARLAAVTQNTDEKRRKNFSDIGIQIVILFYNQILK